MKKVTVITPCHNSKKYLGECLESLENQTIGVENLEFILVNDASTDNTWDMILEFEKKYPESVIAINLPENRRQGGARNEALKYATGEYIAFLDSDDKALPETYEKVYQRAIETDADIVQFNHCNYTTDWEELCDNCKIEGVTELKDKISRKLFLMAEVLTMNHCSKLYRRKLLEESQAQFAEHRIYEEPAFVYPQMFYVKKVCCMKEAFYRIRMNEESTMHSEAKKSERLVDHPEVQMQVLRYMIAHRQLMMDYYDEIEFYFLKTYYVETLFFAGQGNMILGVEYFKKMQNNVKELFPEWRSNAYLQGEEIQNVKKILDTVYNIYSQEELIALCRDVYRTMAG
ncbi:glycosyltransferase family 2 protein [Roseburia sp. 499]|uniref:glycosyltransferase family 2 protein n=1 Tax=Roseburia sp. 499 TaxID=1261634 RepID=UPI0009515304|nr:glycosyltransferase family 2 protein [Roseburia sp. 499]WVK70024.1 glycosyltransferase family 2 protein [Roseburia sp. 499]